MISSAISVVALFCAAFTSAAIFDPHTEASSHIIFAVLFLTIAIVAQLYRGLLRARALREFDPQNKNARWYLPAGERKLLLCLEQSAESLRAVEWDRDLSAQLSRPLDQHPLVQELTQPAALRKLSTVELYQRVLTIIAGFTRARAAAVVFGKPGSLGTVAYGVSGKRFEQQLKSVGEQVVVGNDAAIGLHDSFDSKAIWGGFGSFGHRFSILLPLTVDDVDHRALVWLGYAHGAKPSTIEYEAAIQLMQTVSNALLATQRLVELGSRAETAEIEKKQTSQMLAQVSHDIRTPLSNVKSILHLLGQERGADELISVALQNCEELGELVGDVIDFTRGRTGQLVARSEPVDISAVCKRVVSSCAISAKQRGLQLTLDGTEGAWVLGDAGHLKRVVTNLVSNALKYTQHGTVAVRVDVTENRKVTIVIQDSGLGMNEDQLSQLFTPFTRFHRNQADGIGLGLAITKLFVEEHGGTIAVRSQPQMKIANSDIVSSSMNGTTFTISIPLLEPTLMNRTLNSQEIEVMRPRVLVVDDDLDMGHSMARLLAQADIIVTTAVGVTQAKEALSRDSFVAVITDSIMPAGGGRAILDAVHALGADAPAVFVLSGDCNASLVREFKALGAVDVFEKPVESAVLIAAIHSVCSKSVSKNSSSN